MQSSSSSCCCAAGGAATHLHRPRARLLQQLPLAPLKVVAQVLVAPAAAGEPAGWHTCGPWRASGAFVRLLPTPAAPMAHCVAAASY